MEDQVYVSRNPERQHRIELLAGQNAIRLARKDAEKAYSAGDYVDPFWVEYFGLKSK
jgi:hypothetical protein